MSSHLEQYFAFIQRHPELFVNPPGAEITILLDEEKIREAEAQRGQFFAEKGLPAEWAQVGIVNRDLYGILLRDAVRFSDGTLGTYIRFVRDGGAPGVVILPVYQKRVLLMRHFRHATRTWHIEIPRGFGEAGLTNEENARRELQEETEAVIEKLVPLGQAYPDTGSNAGYIVYFYAEIASYGATDVNEGISSLFLATVDELEDLIRNNTINDEFTIVAYTYAKLQKLLP